MKKIKNLVIKEFKNGFMDFESDNPALFTTRFYLICHLLNILDEDDKKRHMNAIKSLERIKNGKPVRGLYNRHPLKNQRSIDHDDYVGLAISSFIFDAPEIAQAIDDYGREHFYSYDNKTCKFNITEIRQFFDILLYRVCAKRKIGFLGAIGVFHLFFKIFLYMFMDTQATSSRLLDFMRLEVMKHKWYIKPHYWLYNKILNKQYRAGIYSVFKIYHYDKKYMLLLVNKLFVKRWAMNYYRRKYGLW